MPVEVILNSEGFQVTTTYSRKISIGDSLFQSHLLVKGYILKMLDN